MKKTIGSFLLCLALLFSVPLPALAAAPNGVISVQVIQWDDHTYTPSSASVVGLTLNGRPLPSDDVPALIYQSRTLVPVRLVGEALQAQVLWVQATSQVILIKEGSVVVLTLDSDHAVVNGVVQPLPDGVPAMAIRYQDVDRTMIPLRFVSEALGAEVEWEQETYTAHITADLPQPEDPEPPEVPSAPEGPDDPDLSELTPEWLVKGIQAPPASSTVFIATDRRPDDYQLLDLGDRIAIDLPGAGLQSGLTGAVTVNSNCISAVRYAQHGAKLCPGYDCAVRVVLDLKPGVSYLHNIDLEILDAGILVTTHASDIPEGPADFPIEPVEPQSFTIVLDPGHGGNQPGAVYEEIQEKYINLGVGLKLEAILRELGYNVIMTRYDDSGIGLYDRAEVANDLGADIFVSLHSNAAVNSPRTTGIYTYYHPGSTDGPVLARAIQGPVCETTGAKDRGIERADFVVLRETDMCAVLVEMGFMSNHDELMLLMEDAYREQLASGIAQGIVTYLNDLAAHPEEAAASAPQPPAVG